MKERQKHREAFERYVAMGEGRSLARVANEMRVSESAVKVWSRHFRWAQRLEDRSRQIAESLAKETTHNAEDELRKDKQLVRLGLVQLAKWLVEGKIKGSLADMDRMIRLKRELDDDGRRGEDLAFTVTWPTAAPSDDEAADVEEARETLRRKLESIEDQEPSGPH